MPPYYSDADRGMNVYMNYMNVDEESCSQWSNKNSFAYSTAVAKKLLQHVCKPQWTLCNEKTPVIHLCCKQSHFSMKYQLLICLYDSSEINLLEI